MQRERDYAFPANALCPLLGRSGLNFEWNSSVPARKRCSGKTLIVKLGQVGLRLIVALLCLKRAASFFGIDLLTVYFVGIPQVHRCV